MPLVMLRSRSYMWHLAKVRKHVVSIVLHRMHYAPAVPVREFPSLCGMVLATPSQPVPNSGLLRDWRFGSEGWCKACIRVLEAMKAKGVKL